MQNELFYCEHLLENPNNLLLIRGFEVSLKSGKGLETYLKKTAVSNENTNNDRTYLIKDHASDELVGYFSLKAGMISQKESNKFTHREFDTVPGIELSNFAVNSKYKEAHDETLGIGEIIFLDFIIPICKQVSLLIGAQIIYIFALPYKELLKYYEALNFSRLSYPEEQRIHKRIRPRYDKYCIFMSRSIFTADEK